MPRSPSNMPCSLSLFNVDNSDSDGELIINSDYAKNYNNWRQKEELNKLKTKYGENIMNAVDDESSESSSSEDDDENTQDQQFDKIFYKTLACLKKKDPCIYDENIKFFNDIDKPGTSKDAEAKQKIQKKPKKEETLFLRDYERKIITERNGQFSSEDEDDTKEKVKIKTFTYVEEQKQLKDSFKHALNNEDEDEDINLLKIKQKTENEKHKEEESYKEWLKGQKSEINAREQEELKPLRDFWIDPNLDVNEKFLRDYILNNKYMDRESSNTDLDYHQIAHDSDANLSEDEKNIQKQEEFEHKYNFRFEEPDREFIKRYPRTMENSLRKKDTRRAQKRTEVKQRKEEEKQRKREELKHLKVLKRKEIEEKIEKLKEITGNNDMCFDNVDFDADFDPNEHDKKMKELFNDEYYADIEEDAKPEFPEIDEELNIERTWDNYDPTIDEIDTETGPYEELHCEDPDFNMDADYDQSRDLQSEIIESTKKRRRKRRSKFATLIAKEKPKFDPKQFPSYEEYFDQYYSLDYEDMIGDLPCRFKYRKVVPNDYGLNVEEILMADDRELNKWCSLKRALQHKSEQMELKDVQSYKQKAINEVFKRKVLKSLYTEPEEEKEELRISEHSKNDEEIDTSNKKRRRKKKKTKIDNCNLEYIGTDIASKKQIVDLAESNVQKNPYNSKNNEKQDNSMQEQDFKNKNKKQKRKNASQIDTSNPKKIKTNNMEKEKSQSNENITREDCNKEVHFSSKKSGEIATIQEKDQMKKKSQANKIKTAKRKNNNGNADPLMFLNAERLQTYGINARKFKNKLIYCNKKL